jgi:hypothetical protein
MTLIPELPDCPKLPFQLVGKPDIVGSEDGNPFASRSFNAIIQC